jgi:hypothetical protein
LRNFNGFIVIPLQFKIGNSTKKAKIIQIDDDTEYHPKEIGVWPVHIKSQNLILLSSNIKNLK